MTGRNGWKSSSGVCFVLAALASGTETALTSVGRLRVRYLAEQGSKAAATLARLRADPNRFLSTVLFTNTLALIVASTSSALLSDSLFTRWGCRPSGGCGSRCSPRCCCRSCS